MASKLMRTQTDGYWLTGMWAGQAVLNGIVSWRYGLADPFGIAALFVAGLAVGLALASLAILNERMKINRIFGLDVYDPESKKTIGKTTETQA